MGRQDSESETLIPTIGGGFDVAHALTASGFDASEDGTGRGTPLVPVAFAQNSRDEVRIFGGDGGIVGALAAEPGMKQQSYIAQAIGFNARQDPDSWLERTGPLDTDPFTQATATATAVRRLTPRECERLQGFPDDFTLIPVRGKPAADGPRYKALGNSMAVPCMRWIGERIAAVEALAMERAA